MKSSFGSLTILIIYLFTECSLETLFGSMNLYDLRVYREWFL